MNAFRKAESLQRRQLLQVGSSSFLGFQLAHLLGTEALQASETKQDSKQKTPRNGFGSAKHVILLYLQGGPSQIDLWDPKENVPDNVKSVFKSISTKLPGEKFTELIPQLANVADQFSLIRSLSYSPKGLFNHTGAMYQSLTGYAADNISPAGQLEPPSPKDFPTLGSQVIKHKPLDIPMLPFVAMPRPLQESDVINKGGTAGFLGPAYDPYMLFPSGSDTDENKMNRINVSDLQLRSGLSQERFERRAKLRQQLNQQMPEINQAVKKYDLKQYYQQATSLIQSGKAKEAFNLQTEKDSLRDQYGRTTFGQCCLLARRLVEAGTRFVQVNWPKVANSDQHSLDVHENLTTRMKDLIGPMLDPALATLITDLDQRGLLNETLVVAVGEFGRSPQRGVSTSGNKNADDGRDHWPYCYSAILTGAGIKRGYVFGKSDKTGSAPVDDPIHPTDLLATIYHAVGIHPETMVLNHLNQPRELVKGKVIGKLFG